MAEFVETSRGGKILHYEGYIYLKIRDGKDGFVFWRCQQHRNGCVARATSEGTSVIVRREHNHPRVAATMQADRVVSKMRKRAREETTPMNQIYDEALQVSSYADLYPRFLSLYYMYFFQRRTRFFIIVLLVLFSV